MGWQIVARVYLDSGTRRISDQPVRSPSEYFEGRVLDWGFIDRSIAIPVGLPRTSDAKIRIADTDKSYRIPLQTETARRRKAELIRFQEGSALSTGVVIFTGEVQHVRRGPGYIEMTVKDRSFAWLDEPTFPNLINRTRFPDLSEDLDEAFFPVIFGEVLSPASNPQGVIPLPRISDTRWAVCVTFIEEVTAVYRKNTADDDFSLVSSSEYSLTTVSEFFENASYDFQFLDFTSAQDPGTQIRIDAKGITFSHLFQEDLGTSRRNPVDHIYTMLKVILLRKMPPGNPEVDDVARRDQIIEDTMLDRESALETFAKLETGAPSSGGASDTTAYLSDGAMISSMTFRAWLGRILTSSNIDLFARRDGRIAMTWNYEGAADDPEINDTFAILRETFFQDDADPTKNRIRYHYMPNLATNEFAEVEAYDNLEDQDTLGTPAVDSSGSALADSAGVELRDPFIEEEEVNFWYVRDALTALDVASIRASVQALGAFRFMWRSPGPEFIDALDLTEFVRLVHVIESLGATPAKIYQLTEKLGPQVVDVKAIAVPALPIEIPAEEVSITAQATLQLTNTQEMFGLDSIESTYKSTQVDYNPAEWDGISASWFEIVASNDVPDPETDSNSVFLVDEDGTEYAEIEVTWSELRRVRVAFTLPATQKKLMLKMGADGTFNSFVYVTKAVLLFDLVESTKCLSQIVFAAGGVSSGGGFGDSDENDWWAYQATGEQTGGYGYDGSSNQDYRYRVWNLDKSKWSTVSTWRFEVIAAAESGNTPADEITIALFDKTDDAIVPGTALSFTGSTSGPIHAVAPERKTVDVSDSLLVDGHDYEIRQWKSAGSTNDLGLRHRAALYAVVTDAQRAIFYHPLTIDLIGTATASSRNRVEQRYFHDASKFVGASFKLEATAWELGGGASLELLDVGTADEGSQLATQLPTTQSVISGSWTTPENILAEDNATAEVTLNTSGATAILEAGGFGFDSVLPDGAVIISVELRVNIGRVGQDATQCGRGVDNGSPLANHCTLEPESTVLPPILLNGRTYTLTADNDWTKDELLDANFDARVQATHPANTTSTTYYWDFVKAIVGWGAFIGDGLDFAIGVGANGVRERQVLDLTLTDVDRYMLAYSNFNNAVDEITTGAAHIAAEVSPA